MAAVALAPALTISNGGLTTASATRRKQRRRVGAFGERKTDRNRCIEAERSRPACRDDDVQLRGRAKLAEAASRASVMPSIGKAAIDPEAESMTTGRPERNSASPRSTAI